LFICQKEEKLTASIGLHFRDDSVEFIISFCKDYGLSDAQREQVKTMSTPLSSPLCPCLFTGPDVGRKLIEDEMVSFCKNGFTKKVSEFISEVLSAL
jgi:hypothetical protein